MYVWVNLENLTLSLTPNGMHHHSGSYGAVRTQSPVNAVLNQRTESSKLEGSSKLNIIGLLLGKSPILVGW